MWGEITIKGITKNIKLTAKFGGILKDPWGTEKAGFTISGNINRTDFEMSWNTTLDTGGLMVSENILISCEIVLVNTTPSALIMELLPSEESLTN